MFPCASPAVQQGRCNKFCSEDAYYVVFAMLGEMLAPVAQLPAKVLGQLGRDGGRALRV